jgi:hypothetical protein
LLIKNTTPRIVGTRVGDEKVRLRPGTNDVKPELWEEVRKYTAIVAMLDSGDLVEPAQKTPAAAPQVTSLEAFNEREAIRLVKETVDPDLLELWAAGEKRKKVAAALEAQAKAIDPKVKVTGEGDEGDEGDDEEPGQEA